MKGYPQYPISKQQTMEALKPIKYYQKIDLVIRLKVSLDTIKKRITGRIICSKCGNTYNEFFNPPNVDSNCCKKKFLIKREDDNVDVAVKRYDTYENSTEPVLDFYNKLNLVKDINGETDIKDIYSKICSFLNVIEG